MIRIIFGNPEKQVLRSSLLCLTILTILDAATAERTMREVHPSSSLTCGSLCVYDDWFQRAKCENLGFMAIPNSTGCEGANILDIQNNNISLVSSDILSGYSNIVILDLSNNSIVHIKPGTFKNTHYIENMFLSRNQIRNLTDGTFIGPEHRLIRLFLDNNKLRHLHELTLKGLRKLKTLTFSNNLLHDLPDELFKDLTSLQYLHLSGNKLTHLKSNIFSGLVRLKSISLDRNYLSSIPVGLFSGLESLTSVDLSYNHLTVVPTPEDLGIQSCLKFLNLYGNNFNSSSSIIPYLERNGLLVTVTSNPFECDCKFKALQEWFQRIPEENQHLVTDRSPLECRWNGSLVPILEDLSPMCLIPSEYTTFSTSTMGQQKSFTSRAQTSSSRQRPIETYDAVTTVSSGNHDETQKLSSSQSSVTHWTFCEEMFQWSLFLISTNCR
ncbi:putative chondroadherin-like protein [Apostichopus japonicus]|uniref:Putative chondroadherin-like protein n=1 Tax=Stichopus japonicus TaxID=307972 RepID=A0A2G8L821_STIJA|nr:putative chondroadherin-like protein [Apostichopus japonicus]